MQTIKAFTRSTLLMQNFQGKFKTLIFTTQTENLINFKNA